MAGKSKKLFRFDFYLLILAVVSFLFLLSVVRYSIKTELIPQWDEQYYMEMATTYWRLLQHPTPNIMNDLVSVQGVKQMGYPLMILPFLLIFGLKESYFWALFTNGILYVVTIFGVYFVAKNYISKLSSFMAAVIFSCFGWTLFHVHFTYSETASSATIIWTIYFLIKSNLFRNRTHSILFGLLLGFSLFTRWIAPIFLAGPFLYVGFHIIKNKLFRKKYAVINILLAALVAFAVSFYPYYLNFYLISKYFYGVRVGGELWQTLPESQKSQFSLYSLTFYFNVFNTLGTYFFGLIVAGLILAFTTRGGDAFGGKKPRKITLILLSVIISWIFFSFFSILKEDRYIIPIYPYLAIISASVFDGIKNLRIKLVFIFITLSLSFLTFLATDWGKGPLAKFTPIPLPFQIGEVKNIYLASVSRPPYIYKISGREIIEYLVEKDSQFGALFYTKALSEPMMTYNLYYQEKPLNIINFLGTVVKSEKEIDYALKTIFENRYILTKTGEKVDKSFSEENIELIRAIAKLFEKDPELKKYYIEQKRFWIYQDSSELIVYEKNAQIPPEEYERLRLELLKYLKLQ